LYHDRRIALVIPAHNEERLIRRTLDHAPDLIDSIIVVDDASTDRTADIVQECSSQDPRIGLLRHPTNRGPGGAIITGYKWVLQADLDIAVVSGADFQMPFEQLPDLLDPLLADTADYTKGNRFLDGRTRRRIWPRSMPKSRLVGNALLTFITKFASGYYRVGDVVNGYTAISRVALACIDWDRAWPGYGYPIDFLIRFHSANIRVADVPQRTVYLDGERQSQIRVVPYFRGVVPILARGLIASLTHRCCTLNVITHTIDSAGPDVHGDDTGSSAT